MLMWGGALELASLAVARVMAGEGRRSEQGDTMGKYVKKQSTESSESWLTKLAIWWFVPLAGKKIDKGNGRIQNKSWTGY